ncbi:MAG: SemiSWEET family transporter [Candidatus Daviesbacteria bacterium]|nr:SemiSWEET family transporter [Candidatus Daviesbacteria bacterium]
MNELIGFVAGSLIAISVFPQVLKSWKTKSTKDISIAWSIINLAGQILWVCYGLLITSYPLVIMSGITLLMNISMIILKLKYG